MLCLNMYMREHSRKYVHSRLQWPNAVLFYIDVHIFFINVLMYRAFVKMWGEVG